MLGRTASSSLSMKMILNRKLLSMIALLWTSLVLIGEGAALRWSLLGVRCLAQRWRSGTSRT